MLARLGHIDRQQHKQRTKDYVPLLLNGKIVLGFLDSGNNLPGVAMSLAQYVSMGLNPKDLISVANLTQVATAKAGSSLKICGTTKKPLSFQFGGIKRNFSFFPLVIKNLSMPLNIGIRFMTENKIDQLHSSGHLLIAGKKVPLVDKKSNL